MSWRWLGNVFRLKSDYGAKLFAKLCKVGTMTRNVNELAICALPSN
jgi:hypothetical protein